MWFVEAAGRHDRLVSSRDKREVERWRHVRYSRALVPSVQDVVVCHDLFVQQSPTRGGYKAVDLCIARGEPTEGGAFCLYVLVGNQ